MLSCWCYYPFRIFKFVLSKCNIALWDSNVRQTGLVTNLSEYWRSSAMHSRLIKSPNRQLLFFLFLKLVQMHLIFSVNGRLSPIYKLPKFPHFLFISFVHNDDVCNNLTSLLLPLVMLGASDGYQVHNPQSCSARPLVADTKRHLDVSCQVLIR